MALTGQDMGYSVNYPPPSNGLGMQSLLAKMGAIREQLRRAQSALEQLDGPTPADGPENDDLLSEGVRSVASECDRLSLRIAERLEHILSNVGGRL